MRKIILLITFFWASHGLIAQDLSGIPDIIPPSPEATNMTLYGNNSVNYYTGATDVKIPIYTIREKGYELPIYLGYNGSNGIKVQDIASWVGLGWNLSAGGVVSRTIRGLADDDQIKKGLLNNPIPIFDIDSDNIFEFKEILRGDRDGEPDQFNYNIPGYSGSFFLKKVDGEVITVQKIFNNCKINPIFYSYPENPRFTLKGFEIITPEGIIHTFLEKEETRSYIINSGSQISDIDFKTTSWYLSNITDYNHSYEITFEYESLFEINTIEEVSNNEIWFNEQYEDQYHAYLTKQPKRIKKIEFSNGSVNFIMPETKLRSDIKNDKWLDKIEIRNNDRIIDYFQFKYDYFTSNSIEPVENYISIAGDASLRLCLKSIQRQNEVPHSFTYNSSVFLPERNSKARDHWGYYNGKIGNQTLEPQYRVLFENTMTSSISSIDITTLERKLLGEADRFPDPNFSQAGTLTRIDFPTGGFSEFKYENHKVSDDANSLVNPLRKLNKFIENDLDHQTITISLPVRDNGDVSKTLYSDSHYITISLIDQPFAVVSSRPVSFTETVIYYLVFDPIDPDKEEISFPMYYDDNGVEVINTQFYVEPGNYFCYIKAVDLFEKIVFSNDPPLLTNIQWDNELPTPIRTVGGLRIRSIISNDGENSYIKEYSYLNENPDKSSGSLVIVPEYGYLTELYYQSSQLTWPDKFAWKANLLSLLVLGTGNGDIHYTELTSYTCNSYIRTVNTNRPLVYTQGSSVGYSRVEVKDINSNGESNGKSVFYYSTSNDYPDDHYYWEISPTVSHLAYDGGEVQSVDYLTVPANTKDYLRGKLIAEVYYKDDTEIKRVDYSYESINYTPDKIVQQISTEENVWGLVCRNISRTDEIGMFEYYKEIGGWTGIKTIKKVTQDVISETENFYFRLHTLKPYYDLTYTQFKIDQINTKTKYYLHPYDYNSTNQYDLYYGNNTNANEKIILDSLISKNIIVPIEKQVFLNSDTLDMLRTNYKIDGHNNLVKDNVQKWEIGKGLKTELEFLEYDEKANLLSTKAKNGTTINYLWSYNQSLPVAKIVGIEYQTVKDVTPGALKYTIDESVISTALNDIRNSLPNKAFVNTYIHYPLIGVKSQTDPRGINIYFNYDELGRLVEVRNHENVVIKEYEYNIGD